MKGKTSININYSADFVLNNNQGGTVSLVEVKSYPKISKSIKSEVLNQLESIANKIDSEPLRYFTLLSTATGYVKDIKSDKDISFDMKPILNDYLKSNERKLITPRLLTDVYFAWLRDLSFGLRDKLTKPERELKQFGFIDNIKNTFPKSEAAI